METFDISGGRLPPGWGGVLVVFGAIMAVVVIIFLWAVVFHKRGVKQRRRRHRSRENGPNPTLAETGGLPPIRDEENPPEP